MWRQSGDRLLAVRTVWEQAVLDVLAPTGVILMACVPVDDPAKTKVRGSSLAMQ